MYLEPTNKLSIERIANRLLVENQPEVLKNIIPFNIEEYVELVLVNEKPIDYRVTYDLLPSNGVYGMTLPPDPSSENPSRSKLIISPEIAEDPKSERFFRSTLAHELGHCTLHLPSIIKRKIQTKLVQLKKEKEGFKLYRQDDLPIYMNPEWQAWHFAKSLLMPKEPLIKLLQQGRDENYIADAFNVNPAFVRSRIRTL